MNEDYKTIYCEKCKKETRHIRSGFGEIGGLTGNARWRCLRCDEERV